jgi:Protein phosphatase 2C
LFLLSVVAITNQPDQEVNPAVIQEAYQRTDNSFMHYVRNNWHQNPELASVGSCCLVGLVYNNILYVANSGDSRAVLARCHEGGDFEVVQLSVDYNAKYIERRQEVRAEHPDDPGLFKYANGPRLRGTLQVIILLVLFMYNDVYFLYFYFSVSLFYNYSSLFSYTSDQLCSTNHYSSVLTGPKDTFDRVMKYNSCNIFYFNNFNLYFILHTFVKVKACT